MQVRFYATLRDVVGGPAVEVPAPAGAPLRQIIAAVVARFPALQPKLLDEQGELLGYVHAFLNGRDAHYLDRGLDTPVLAEDSVDIFPAVAGGGPL